MPSNICITSADGQTGHLIAELLLTDDTFASKVSKLTCVALHPGRCEDLKEHNATVIQYRRGSADHLADSLKQAGVNTVMLIPPASKDKMTVTREFNAAIRRANVPNAVLLSSAACDLAEEREHARLREFAKMEAEFMQAKSLTAISDTQAGATPCIVR